MPRPWRRLFGSPSRPGASLLPSLTAIRYAPSLWRTSTLIGPLAWSDALVSSSETSSDALSEKIIALLGEGSLL